MIRFNQIRAFALLLPLALILGAYASQYIGKLYPCEMCWWQRYPHFAAIGFAALAYVGRNRFTQNVLVALAALAILTSGLIGGFHAGVEYNYWEGLTRCSTTMVADGGDFTKSIMNAPLVRCDVAPWTLFGISLAGYNFLLSSLGAIAILIALWKNQTA
jgi:disulfide bond formation protein DsbB